jgi:hypothetical protein
VPAQQKLADDAIEVLANWVNLIAHPE